MAKKKSPAKKKAATKLRPKGAERLVRLRLGKDAVSSLPWREAWVEAGEPWAEWVEVAWGRRDPQAGNVTDLIDPAVSATELWLRFRAAEPGTTAQKMPAARKASTKTGKRATAKKKRV